MVSRAQAQALYNLTMRSRLDGGVGESRLFRQRRILKPSHERQDNVGHIRNCGSESAEIFAEVRLPHCLRLSGDAVEALGYRDQVVHRPRLKRPVQRILSRQTLGINVDF